MLVTFDSISSSLCLQAAAAASPAERERHFTCTLIPVPRTISSSCGYAAEIEMEEGGELLKLLGELNVGWDAVYRPCGKEYQVMYNHGAGG
jgi:hypothetical protein